MSFTSQSQAGQDHFVHALLPKADGTFLDIGCAGPKDINNTWALEQLGWTGILLDGNINSADACRAARKNPVVCADATTCDWQAIFREHQPTWGVAPRIDYLSLDVDEATHDALRNLLRAGPRFNVITIEHDQYQRGDRLRLPNRALLLEQRYELIAADVHSLNCSFEDWWVSFSLLGDAERFRSQGLDWKEVLKKGGVTP